MNDPTGIAIALGLTAVAFGVGYVVDKKRTEAITAWAKARSLTFEATQPSLVDELSGFKLFTHGSAKQARNCSTGRKDGLALRVVDYQYKTGSGRNTRTHRQTVCILDGDDRSDVHFFCRRQSTLFDAIGRFFGGQDVNFDDDPAFSKAFVLQTNDDEARLRSFFRPRLRALLVELAQKNIVLEVAGGTLVLHMGRRIRPDDLDDLVDVAVRIRRCFA